MKNHFYFEVMRRTIIQFLDLFNDLRIARYDLETGKLLKYISVPLTFSPKMKQWWWKTKLDANGKKQHDIILPHVAVILTDIELDSGRIVNKHAKVRSERVFDDVLYKRFKNPVPYNYSFEVKIASEYMIDATQIIEQILPFFDPTAYIRVTIPDLTIDHKDEQDDLGAYPMDLKVVYEGASSESSIDMGEDEYRTLIWTLSFKVEGYLFKPEVEDKIIKTAFIDYYTHENGQWAEVPVVETTTTGLSSESWPITLSGGTSALPSGAIYDDSIKLWYTYEREGN